MEMQILYDKSAIRAFLRQNAELQIYCIGDLDDFFWPDTTWYGLVENGNIQSIALLYAGMEVPTLLMFYEKSPDFSLRLLECIKPFLPEKFFAHLSPGLVEAFGKENIIENYGVHYKMALRKTPSEINDANIRRLSIVDLPVIQEFYLIAYPQNWFDKRMLETKKYFGYFINDRLAGIAGIHVYSREYKVAALGNIATLPDYRGKQIGFRLTSKLCGDLIKEVDNIGLNVKADNESAIKCYYKTGFEIIGRYDECFMKSDKTNIDYSKKT
jgi:ribosomal protein S18 acetylase RimI-like enzyme